MLASGYAQAPPKEGSRHTTQHRCSGVSSSPAAAARERTRPRLPDAATAPEEPGVPPLILKATDKPEKKTTRPRECTSWRW